MKLSVIIPSYKDPLLQKTIDSLFESSALGNELEVIAALDGYWPTAPLKNDDRLKIIHLGKNRGMRDAINAGVLVSQGEYIMRTDEHCIFGKDYDRILVESCQPDWIMTARRYFLNPKEWKVMDIPPVDYERLTIQDNTKFAGQPWRSRGEKRKEILIDETMAMQGSMWMMKRSWWNEVIGELQSDGYGTHYQDSHEMVFKTWKKGGKLMVNKNTWFAHKHRSFPRTHNYGTAEALPGWTYSLNLWRDYYLKDILPKWTQQ